MSENKTPPVPMESPILEERFQNDSCCGCEACVNACPADCIFMEENREGFRYPRIIEEKCVQCGKCAAVCPSLNHQPSRNSRLPEPEVYAAWALDETIRRQSSSGGVFSVIAQYFLEQKGLVAGAVFQKGLELEHILIEQESELKKLRGSKYIQSRIGLLYRKIIKELENDRPVFFTGTPCQVAGLYAYLGGDHPRLLTGDLVCHGIPSGKVFRMYISMLELKYKKRVTGVAFRDKRSGWKKYHISINIGDNYKLSRFHRKDPFFHGFLKNLYLRPSCHNCRYATIPRVGDLTLGDFWGVRRIDPSLDDDLGTSLVLLNSEKAQNILQNHQKELYMKKCQLEQAVDSNLKWRMIP